MAAVKQVSGHEFRKHSVGTNKNDGLAAVPDGETIDVFPGVLGGVESPIAFSEGVVGVAARNFPTYYSSTETNFGEGCGYDTATTNILALDGATGEILWDNLIDVGIAGSGPTVSTDILFVMRARWPCARL